MTPLNLTARFWRASIAIAILIGITACGEGETNLLNPGTTREIGAPPDTISGVLLSADRSYRPRIATGSLVALTIADQDQLTSQAYLRFDSDDLPDTNGVAIGNLGLRFLRGSGGALRLRASEIASDAPVWTEDDLPLDPLPVEEPFFVSDRSFAPAEGETLIVTDAVRIPASILKRWKTDPESNRGIALALEPTRTGLLRILSKEAVIDTAGNAVNPQLEILRNDGAPVLLAPVEDAYRLVDDSPPAAGNAAALLIEQSVPHEALFRFDLASTPLEKGAPSIARRSCCGPSPDRSPQATASWSGSIAT
ncbi:MAG: hypothetical protein R3E12_11530 [Candidatus Eisenbacteria bacterium]